MKKHSSTRRAEHYWTTLVKFKKLCGILTAMLLSTGIQLSANADLVTVTFNGNQEASADVNAMGAAEPTVTFGAVMGTPNTNSVLSQVITVSGWDLSSIESGATNVSFDFTVTYTGANTAGPAAVQFSSNDSGNIGVVGNQINVGEIFEVAISDPRLAPSTFGGTLAIDGFRAEYLQSTSVISGNLLTKLTSSSRVGRPFC